FSLFPRQLGDWRQSGPPRTLSASVERVLAADDYRSVMLTRPGELAGVEFFSAWYDDQSEGGVHSPEICLPGGGWEIAWLERSDITARMNADTPFMINRAIIQKGETRMMVFYWFEQKGRKIAWDMAAKYHLLVDGIRTGRTDGAIVRLTTPIEPGESDAGAEARLMDVLTEVMTVLPRFIPDA
ncbi:MAG: EpsI family protein, partial [Alphaproteobacteria bacterium]|nr:EpsI family protein [Alphaproteobacteria bacterium]